MPREGRIVIPGVPHHVTQRGSRGQAVFLRREDYDLYRRILSHWSCRCGVEIWAYALMSNHIHLIAVPREERALAKAVGQAHRGYSRLINARQGWVGHLWQERFSSFPMDERYLLAAARYVELNPVRAGLVEYAGDYPFSSAGAHLTGGDDILVMAAPLLDRCLDWHALLLSDVDEAATGEIRRRETTGAPLGRAGFTKAISAGASRDAPWEAGS